MMDEGKEPQTDEGSSDQPTHAPRPVSEPCAGSVSDLQPPKAAAEGPLKQSDPTGLVANLKPLACLHQPKRQLLPRPSSNSPLTPSTKAFGIASLNLQKLLPPTSFKLPSQSSTLVLEPSPPSPTLPRPATSIHLCQTPQKSTPKTSRKSASLKLGRSLEASLARIQKFRQRKAVNARQTFPSKLVEKRTGRKASLKKDLSLPPPPPPPSPPPPSPLPPPPATSRQCHPFELLIATALLELQEPCHHDEDKLSGSDFACLDLRSRKSKRKIHEDGTGTSDPSQEPKQDPAESWASFSKERLFPSLVEMFGGEPGSDIPENCVPGIHVVGSTRTQVPAACFATDRESGSSSDDGDLEDEESDGTVADKADDSAMCWENGMEVDLPNGSVEEVTPCLEDEASLDCDNTNLQEVNCPSTDDAGSSIQSPTALSGFKKRAVDEQELKMPLELGWRRETKIKPGAGRPQGQVTYFAPCGKKLRRYPEVEKYLSRNGINGITCDNFSFIAKINVGDFYESREGPQGSEWSPMQVDEIPSRLSAMEGQRGRPRNSAPQAEVEASGVLCRALQAPNATNPLQSTFRVPIQLEAQAEQRRYHETAKQQRKPEKQPNKEQRTERETESTIEDLCLSDHKPLPVFSRILGLILPGRVVLDCLMVMQFTGNFEKVLGLDLSAYIPTLGVFQEGLLNVGDSMGRVLDLLVQLVSLAVVDPGVPPALKTKTILGEHLTNVAINRENVSEVLQIYMGVHCTKTNLAQLALSLKTKAFQAHTPAQKASILRFMADELACSKAVVGEIDKGLNQLATLRKDCIGILEKLKLIATHSTSPRERKEASVSETPCVGLSSVLKRKRLPESSNGDSGQGESEDKVEKNMSEDEPETKQKPSRQEEVKKEIKELAKNYYQNRRRLFEVSHSMRSMMYGQDRYHRRYWVLPHCGGVFVEGMRSGEGGEQREAQRPISLREAPRVSERQDRSGSLELHATGLELPTELLSSMVALCPIQDLKIEDDEEKAVEKIGGRMSSAPSCATSESDTTDVRASASSSSLPIQNGRPSSSQGSAILPVYNQPLRRDSSLLSASPHMFTPPTPPQLTSPFGSNVPYLPQSTLQSQQGSSLVGASFGSWDSSQTSPRLLRSTAARRPLEGDRAATASCERESLFSFFEKTPPMPSPAPLRPKPVDYPTPQPVPEEMLTGWWRVCDVEVLRSLVDSLHRRGVREKGLHAKLSKFVDIIPEVCAKHQDAIQIDLEGQVSVESVEAWCVEEQAMEMDIAALKQVEELERKVAAACLQANSWTEPRPQSERKDLVYYEHKADSSSATWDGGKEKQEVERRPDNPLDIAVTRLGVLERNIDRRYLSSPLGVGAVPPSAPPSADRREASEKDVTNGMKVWRKALTRVCSAAQLAMCIEQLQRSIAWERSIMKVICQEDDNEELLLLCDSCDKGCHTYCHKPMFTDIPDGDWYCSACVTKAKSGKQGADVEFVATQPKKEEGEKNRKKQEGSPHAQQKPVRVRRAKKGRDNNRDMDMCRVLLAELENHQDGRTFLNHVSLKSVPGCEKAIKKPMDFSTIGMKLASGQYETLETFLADVNLLFENCDHLDGELRFAAQSLKKFFEKRFMELVRQSYPICD